MPDEKPAFAEIVRKTADLSGGQVRRAVVRRDASSLRERIPSLL